jgi:hypothetical protein
VVGFNTFKLVVGRTDRRLIGRLDMPLLIQIGAVKYIPVLSELFGVRLARKWRAINSGPYIADPNGWQRASVSERVQILHRLYIVQETDAQALRGATKYLAHRVISSRVILRWPVEPGGPTIEAYITQCLGHDRWRGPNWGWDLPDEYITELLIPKP